MASYQFFRYMFIFSCGLSRSFKGLEHEYDFEDNDTEDFCDEDSGFEENYAPKEDENTIIEQIELPNQLADLIDSNTAICGIDYAFHSSAGENVACGQNCHMPDTAS